MNPHDSTGLKEGLDLGVQMMRPETRTRLLHFDLSFLGEERQDAAYTVKAYGRAHPMRRHTEESLRERGMAGLEHGPTHFAEVQESAGGTVQLARVYGPPGANGIPSLGSVAILTSDSSADDTTVYGTQQIAQAMVYLHPEVTVLTPDPAGTVLGHIGSAASFPQLQLNIELAGSGWAVANPILDGEGKPIIGPAGGVLCTYDLDPGVQAAVVTASGQAKVPIYSDATLSNIRWLLQPGVSSIQLPGAATSDAAATSGGYVYDLQDGGPNFGVSCGVVSLSDDFVLEVAITNSFIRHMSVFASILEGDGVTPMPIPDPEWLKLLKDATLEVVEEWLNVKDIGQILGNDTETLYFLGTVSSESTFMGVPVDSSTTNFKFQLPTDQGATVGKVRILVGSLGVNSGNDFDPLAAWVGIGATSLLDLAIPTYSLVTTAGEESSKLFDAIFKNVPFIAGVCVSVFIVGKDIITGSDNTGNDISSALVSLFDGLVQNVLTSAEVIAQLAIYFGAEEAEEAIPFVGWALKALAMEAAAEQLAQTIGEVVASPRVVEFDLTVTMNAQITLVPEAGSGEGQAEFAATATSYTITAQYSDNTSRVYDGEIPDPNVSQLVASWEGIPVGGTVTFVVALYSEQGWLVGKGTSGTVANLLTPGAQQLEVTIGVEQLLYPLASDTTYTHSQLLTVADGAYAWTETSTPPSETAEALGSGQGGAMLEAVTSITLNEDLGVLGYVWQATGLGIPPVQGGSSANVELWAFKNLGEGPDPDAGVMNAPAGYDLAPQLVYLRTIGDGTGGLTTPVCFFLDPTVGTGGYYLRQIVPVTDPAVPLDDSSRQFDLATGTSWGRFSLLPTSMAIHSNGVVVAVSPQYPSLQILQLPAAVTDDAEAPWAQIAAGPGTRAGMLDTPTLVAITPDQTILVLEGGQNQRVQAFSRGGHPVPYFPGGAYWFPLVSHAVQGEAVTYLSMTVEVKGYVYVLSMNGNGYEADDFFLDVYTPTGEILFTQQGFVAAATTVDLWRNLYTLNFQQITGADGRTEPSVSEWVPDTPNNGGQ